MYPVSDKFLNALRYSGIFKTTVDLYYGTSPVPVLKDLPVKTGTITVDATADNRRTASIEIAGPSAESVAAIEPWGAELQVKSGVVYQNGQEELVPLGRFRIDSRKWSEGDEGHVVLDCSDRTSALMDTVHLNDLDYSGRRVQDLITHIVGYSFSTTGAPTVSFPDVGDTILPGGSIFQGTHWETIKSVASTINAIPYFDVNGNLVVTKQKVISNLTTSADAVWALDVGESGVLISADHTVDRSNSFNAVSVFGGQNNNNVRPSGAWYDTDPRSITYYYGNFGRKTMRLDNDKLTTTEQCVAAAQQKLAETTGLTKFIDFKTLRNPALDVEDIIVARYLDGSEDVMLIKSLSIPLADGDFSGTTKSVQWVIIDVG